MSGQLPSHIEICAKETFLKSDMGFKHSCIIVRQGVVLAKSSNQKIGDQSIHAEDLAISILKGKDRE